MILTHWLRLRRVWVSLPTPTATPRNPGPGVEARGGARAHLHLHHEAPLPPQLDHVAVHVHLVLGLQALQHGVDADVGAGAPHARAGDGSTAASQVTVRVMVAGWAGQRREGEFLRADCPPCSRCPRRRPPRRAGPRPAPSPAVHHDGAAEEVAEGVHPPPQLEEQVGVLGHPVVRPAGELDVSHLPARRLLFFLVKRSHALSVYSFSKTNCPTRIRGRGDPYE